jgi:hypothetical protein
MHKVPGLSGIEFGPEYGTMAEPNDYTATFNENWALDLISANDAWTYTTGDANVTIGVTTKSSKEKLLTMMNQIHCLKIMAQL